MFPNYVRYFDLTFPSSLFFTHSGMECVTLFRLAILIKGFFFLLLDSVFQTTQRLSSINEISSSILSSLERARGVFLRDLGMVLNRKARMIVEPFSSARTPEGIGSYPRTFFTPVLLAIPMSLFYSQKKKNSLTLPSSINSWMPASFSNPLEGKKNGVNKKEKEKENENEKKVKEPFERFPVFSFLPNHRRRFSFLLFLFKYIHVS